MKYLIDETLPNMPCVLFLDEVETTKAIYMVETIIKMMLKQKKYKKGPELQ